MQRLDNSDREFKNRVRAFLVPSKVSDRETFHGLTIPRVRAGMKKVTDRDTFSAAPAHVVAADESSTMVEVSLVATTAGPQEEGGNPLSSASKVEIDR